MDLNKVVKENIFQKELSRFRKMADNLGQEIDQRIIESVVYLNLLGYFTTASCEGHMDHADPFGYIHFGTQTKKREAQNPKSMYWEVFNTARNETFRREKEKFPLYDGTIQTFTEEIRDFFDPTFEEETQKHPKYAEYARIEKEMGAEIPAEKMRIAALVENFKKEFPEAINTICTDDTLAFPNIYFTSKNNASKDFPEDRKIYLKEESDKTLELFRKFLKAEYYK